MQAIRESVPLLRRRRFANLHLRGLVEASPAHDRDLALLHRFGPFHDRASRLQPGLARTVGMDEDAPLDLEPTRAAALLPHIGIFA